METLQRKLTTGKDIINFNLSIDHMNPRERRAMIDSFHSKLVQGEIENLSFFAIDAVAELERKYGFLSHSKKLLNYKSSREELRDLLEMSMSHVYDGMFYHAFSYFNEAREHAAKFGIYIPQSSFEKIEQIGRKSGIEAKLDYARYCADIRFFNSALEQLNMAKARAAGINLDISEKVKEIEAVLNQ